MRYMLLLQPKSEGKEPILLKLYSASETIIPVFTRYMNVERFVDRLGENAFPGGIWLTLDLEADSDADLLDSLAETGMSPETRYVFDTEPAFEGLLNAIQAEHGDN